MRHLLIQNCRGAVSSYVEGIRIQDRPMILYDKLYEGTISCNSSGVGSVTFTVNCQVHLIKM